MVDDSTSMFWDESKLAGGTFSFMKPEDFVLIHKSLLANFNN